MGVQLQFDPVASSIAIVALLTSGYAIYLNKREPARATRRALRVEAREVMQSALQQTGELSRTLASGENIPDKTMSIDEFVGALTEIRERLPEGSLLLLIGSELGAVSSTWHQVFTAQERVSSARARAVNAERMLHEARAAQAPAAVAQVMGDVRRASEELDDTIRRRDALQVQLRTEIADFTEHATEYVRALNAKERAGRDLA